MLDDTSTFAATRATVSDAQVEIAELAGNLASRGGFDPAPVLERYGIEFVVLAPAIDGGDAVRERAAEALDAQSALEAVGDTGRGSLWRFPDHEATAVAPASSPLGTLAIAGQIAVFAFAFLLALPTGRRRRRRAATAGSTDDEALDPDGYESDAFDDDGFGEDDRD